MKASHPPTLACLWRFRARELAADVSLGLLGGTRAQGIPDAAQEAFSRVQVCRASSEVQGVCRANLHVLQACIGSSNLQEVLAVGNGVEGLLGRSASRVTHRLKSLTSGAVAPAAARGAVALGALAQWRCSGAVSLWAVALWCSDFSLPEPCPSACPPLILSRHLATADLPRADVCLRLCPRVCLPRGAHGL